MPTSAKLFGGRRGFDGGKYIRHGYNYPIVELDDEYTGIPIGDKIDANSMVEGGICKIPVSGSQQQSSIVVYGEPGAGKTELISAYIAHEVSGGRDVVVIDIKGEYRWMAIRQNDKRMIDILENKGIQRYRLENIVILIPRKLAMSYGDVKDPKIWDLLEKGWGNQLPMTNRETGETEYYHAPNITTELLSIRTEDLRPEVAVGLYGRETTSQNVYTRIFETWLNNAEARMGLPVKKDTFYHLAKSIEQQGTREALIRMLDYFYSNHLVADNADSLKDMLQPKRRHGEQGTLYIINMGLCDAPADDYGTHAIIAAQINGIINKTKLPEYKKLKPLIIIEEGSIWWKSRVMRNLIKAIELVFGRANSISRMHVFQYKDRNTPEELTNPRTGGIVEITMSKDVVEIPVYNHETLKYDTMKKRVDSPGHGVMNYRGKHTFFRAWPSPVATRGITIE